MEYSPNERCIVIKTDINREPALGLASIINGVVTDLLHQIRFEWAHFPEIVDLAVIMTGLGTLRSHIPLVNAQGTFWDTTQWQTVPKPFLDGQGLAYAMALAARIRGSQDWLNDLPDETRRPAQKSLKYLSKTEDSLFVRDETARPFKARSQVEWSKLAHESAPVPRIIGIRELTLDNADSTQVECLVDGLRASDRDVVLNSIWTAEQMTDSNDSVVQELRFLTENRDDHIRAKSMMALSRLDAVDETTVDVAGKMLNSDARFVMFAGGIALARLESPPDKLLPLVNRKFAHSLQTCDYEFVHLFAAAYLKWFDDPELRLQDFLSEDEPEYLEIAREAFQTVRERAVETV